MTHPYQTAPEYAYWRRTMSDRPWEDVDPAVTFPRLLSRATRVVTSGSCFAQHISRHLHQAGFCAHRTETVHPLFEKEADPFNYGLYAARYGNIYTARQLVQLFDRAYGKFTPAEDCWGDAAGGFIDPFRPQVQPGGFPTRLEFDADRRQHFAAVRKAFEEAEVFVFTLGLTEAWMHREDGAVFPLCPGVAGGSFDERRHVFHNFSVEEVVADLKTFVANLRAVNADVPIVLTVSPVPLMATATDEHVLLATTYSKAVLRAAAGRAADGLQDVFYFPSYEIVTYAGGRYFAPDRRSVTEDGVSHVMRLFFKHAADHDLGSPVPVAAERPSAPALDIAQAICDEEMLDIASVKAP